jgi:hypothetical protein
MRRWLVLALLLVGCGTQEASVDVPDEPVMEGGESEEEAEAEANAGEEIPTAALGEAVGWTNQLTDRTDTMDITVTDVRCTEELVIDYDEETYAGSLPDEVRPSTQGKWCVADVSVTNTGKAPATFDLSGATLVDTSDRSFAYDAATTMTLASFKLSGELASSEGSIDTPLNPSATGVGHVIWDLPVDAEPAALVLGSNGYTSSGVKIEL